MQHVRCCGKNRSRLQFFGLPFNCRSNGFLFSLKKKKIIWFSPEESICGTV